MSNPMVTQSLNDGVLRLALSRPEKRNALTLAMYAALADGLERAEAEPAVRVVVIEGEGADFCAGNDLNDFLALTRLTGTPLERFLTLLAGATKPLVAGVSGAAVGIGSTMLLHCDLVVAADDTRFQFPFVNLALVPEAGSSLLLPRMAGHQRAAELLMLGEFFDAATAMSIGMVNRVVPRDQLAGTVADLAARLAAKPPGALRRTKALLRGADEPLPARIQREADVFAQCLATPELREAITAFFEKRAPDYSKF